MSPLSLLKLIRLHHSFFTATPPICQWFLALFAAWLPMCQALQVIYQLSYQYFIRVFSKSLKYWALHFRPYHSFADLFNHDQQIFNQDRWFYQYFLDSITRLCLNHSSFYNYNIFYNNSNKNIINKLKHLVKFIRIIHIFV